MAVFRRPELEKDNPIAPQMYVGPRRRRARRVDGFFRGEVSDDHNSGHVCVGLGMLKTLPLSEVKTRLLELVAGVQEREEEEVVVTKNVGPAAMLVNVQEYACFKKTLDVLSGPALMHQIGESRAFYRPIEKGFSIEDVFGDPMTPVKTRRTA